MFRRFHVALFVTTTALALATVACSVLFSTSKEQCSTDGDCQARGGRFANTRCSLANVCVSSEPELPDSGPTDGAPPPIDAASDPLGCANVPLPNPDPSKQVELTIRYVDFSSGAAPVGLGARLCAATDPTCANPRATVQGDGPFDAGPEAGKGFVTTKEGVVTSNVELGFEGFFEVRSSAYAPTIRYSSPPLRNAKNDLDQIILRQSEIDFLSDLALGKANSYDAVGHGLVFLLANDCNRNSLGGVSFSTTATDPLMKLFYVINTSPSITETKTDALGRAGYVNMPPGLHTFTATFADTGKRIGSVRVLVRAGTATTVAVLPSP